MTLIKFANAVAVVVLATGATATLANDSDASKMRAEPTLTVALGDDIDQPLTTTRHGATSDTSRIAAPLVVSERPPRPPVSMTRSAGRSEAEGSRISSRHIFPPRGFPRW